MVQFTCKSSFFCVNGSQNGVESDLIIMKTKMYCNVEKFPINIQNPHDFLRIEEVNEKL